MEETRGVSQSMVHSAEDQDVIDTMKGQFLTFWTDEQLFGIPIVDVVQIVGIQDITQIPEFPPYAKGIIKLREDIIPVIDVRLRFGKMEVAYNERTCIIVTNIKGLLVGFIVDSVDEVTGIDDEDISAPPKVSSADRTNAYLTGIGKKEGKVILLLDTQKILNDDALEAVSGAV